MIQTPQDVACEARVARNAHAPSSTEPHVAVRGLAVRRGERVLFENMTWSVPRGKFVAITGPSGVGKSSLLYCLAGLLKPDAGEVQFRCAGGCSHQPEGFKKRLGFVHQDLRLVPTTSLIDNVLCGRLGHMSWFRSLFGFRSRDRQRAYELLKDLGIARHTHRWAGEVSGGEQQRAAIARALLQDPEIFLADEPVAHLDFSSARRVMDVLKNEARHGKTVLCTLHDHALVEEYADIVIKLNPERICRWHDDPSHWLLEERQR